MALSNEDVFVRRTVNIACPSGKHQQSIVMFRDHSVAAMFCVPCEEADRTDQPSRDSSHRGRPPTLALGTIHTLTQTEASRWLGLSVSGMKSHVQRARPAQGDHQRVLRSGP